MDIKQKIEGDVEYVAGRDIHIHGGDIEPDPNNPNLVLCPGCRKVRICVVGNGCPRCGYSFQVEAEIERARAIQAQKAFQENVHYVLIVSIAVVLFSSVKLWQGMEIKFTTALIICSGLWFSFCLLVAVAWKVKVRDLVEDF